MLSSSVIPLYPDLAARNCLVAAGPVIKIADFGLSKDIGESNYYRINTGIELPIRWMAPECMMDGKFDSTGKAACA